MKKRNSLKKTIRGIGEALQKRKNSKQLFDEDVADLQDIPLPDMGDEQDKGNAYAGIELERTNVFDLDLSGLQAYDAKFTDCLDRVEQMNQLRYGGNGSADPWGSSKKFQKYYQRAYAKDKDASYVIGVCYQYGVQPDLEPCHNAAIKWYLIAARLGDWRSINNIGVMIYLSQAGFEKDEELALQFFEHAARHGIREAEMNMTVLLTLGAKGVQDRPRAFEILSRICKRDFCGRQAVNNLGCMYLRGFGCTADPEQAMSLFKTSMDMGSQVAAYNIGIMYLNGLGVEKDKHKGTEYMAAASSDKHHEDYSCIESATDLSKLLMFTTMNSCL